MMTIRPGAERGRTSLEWLESRHSFSFGEYFDPRHTGFRSLRVINEDRIAPGGGFPSHPHRDMEILTYVLEGALEHRDSMGNGSVIRAGELQRMSAGSGVVHSEYNHSPSEPVHLLQIWILPKRRGIAPAYEQRSLAAAPAGGALRLAASSDGRDASLTIHQEAALYVCTLAAGGGAEYALAPGRHLYVQVARGALVLNGEPMEAGDGAALSEERWARLASAAGGEALLFDLA